MIAYLKGTLQYKTPETIIIQTNNVGYELRTSQDIIQTSSQNEELELFVYHHITENHQSLYGFTNQKEREFFMLLISVSGIGPKTAIHMMESSVETIITAILHEDVAMLTELPGIGKKTAERIILELKSKITKVTSIEDLPLHTQANSSEEKYKAKSPLGNKEALEALVTLGYTRLEATRMLGKVPVEITNTEEVIRYSLKSK